jgi:transcriptional regulator with XRE-family HTH domain
MSDRDTFGPRLRAERERRGISLGTIASVTKVSADLWDGLERNDFSRWPSGIFARAFVRDYARAIGVDADEVVNEFCRLFPVGDRRASRLIQAQAELIGHSLSYAEAGAVPRAGDRRAQVEAPPDQRRAKFTPRSMAATIDACATLGSAAAISYLFHLPFWGVTGLLCPLYYASSIATLGRTPGQRVVEALRQRIPTLFALPDRRRATA